MIDISTIVKSINKETTIETELTLTSFESRFGFNPILKKQPISLHISNVENAAVHITGTVDIDIAIPCSRCLEEVPTNMHFDIDKTLKITDGALVDEEMEETDYLIGFELDVDKLVYAEILVNWPMRVLCKDDCKGICKVCGMNLNKAPAVAIVLYRIQEWQRSRIYLTSLRRCKQMSICPKNKSSKGRRDKRRANWKMSAPTLVKCSKCGELMMPHRVCKNCGSYNKKEIIPQD